MPFPSWAEGEGKERGQFILLSDSLSSSCMSSGRREDHFLEVSAEGVPRSLWCPKLSSVQCPRSLLPGTGVSVPVWVGRSQSCSVWLRAVAAFHRGSSVSRRGQAGLLGRLVQARQAHRKPNIMPAMWTCTLELGSNPSASLSPLLCLLPLSSDFEVKVKRANVPDLPDTVSCSGHLLGINKINL